MAFLPVLLSIWTLSCFQGVLSNGGLQPIALPVQCDNSVIELSPSVYIAVETNYSNCTLRGQVGTVIRGEMGPRDPSKRLHNRGLTTLSGSMVLDRLRLDDTEALLINGDEIIVRDSNISTRPQWGWFEAWEFRVLGGKVAFEGVRVDSDFSIELTNTSMTFSDSHMAVAFTIKSSAIDVFGSSISLKHTSIHAVDDNMIRFKSSIVNLSDSDLNLDHGRFVLTDSHATFSRSSVSGIDSNAADWSIGHSSVVADCSNMVRKYHLYNGSTGFYKISVFDSSGARILIDGSKMTFHNCSCDMSTGMKMGDPYGQSEIRVDASSLHFEGCLAPEPVYSTLV